MAEGATEVMEGMAVGGKSCCVLLESGDDTAPCLASHSGVTNLSTDYYYLLSSHSHFNYFLLYYLHASSHPIIHPFPSLDSALKFSTEETAHFQHRSPPSMREVIARGEGRGVAPLSQFHSSACPAFCPPPPKPSGCAWPPAPQSPVDHSTAHFRAS